MNARKDLRAGTLRLPAELDEALKIVAGRLGESQATVVRTFLREALELRGVVGRPEVAGVIQPRPMAGHR